MSDLNLIESDREPGTDVTVESVNTGDQYDAYVGEDGLVRFEENGAAFNADAYVVMHYGK